MAAGYGDSTSAEATNVVSVPTGSAGDLVVVVAIDISASAVTPPAGWLTLRADAASNHWLFVKPHSGSEGSNYTFTFTGPDSENLHAFVLTGVNLLKSIPNTAATGTSNTAQGTAVSAVESGSLLVYTQGTSVDTGTLTTDPSGMTIAEDLTESESWYQTGIGSGTTGTRTGGISGSQLWWTQMAVFAPSNAGEITLVGTAKSSTTATTTFSLAIPAGINTNDVLIVQAVNRDATADPSVTDNDGGTWTKFGGGATGQTLWWRRATSATSGKTISGSGLTGSCAATLTIYRGCKTSGDPFENVTTQSNASGTESHAAITPTVNGAVVCLAVANRANDNAVTTPSTTSPGALVSISEILSTGGSDCAAHFAARRQATAGTTGSFTWAQTNGATVSSVFNLLPAGGTQELATGRADETDTALAVTGVKLAASGLSSETDAAIALTGTKTRAVGLATETDAALALSATKIAAVGIANETDSAFALEIEGATELDTGLATETDVALAPTFAKVLAPGVAQETDAALAPTGTKVATPGIATETDVALARGWHSLQASEVDTALALTATKVRAPGLSSTTDTALAVTGTKLAATGLATETDAALAPTLARVLAAGTAIETDAALAVTARKIGSVGRADEIDQAFSLFDPTQQLPTGRADETDVALALTLTKVRAVGLASESDAALAVTAAKIRTAGRADELSQALAPTVLKGLAVGLASESDSALGLTAIKIQNGPGRADEVSQALAPALLKAAGVGVAIESDAAFAIALLKLCDVGLSAETDAAFSLFTGGAGFAFALAPPERLATARAADRFVSVGPRSRIAQAPASIPDAESNTGSRTASAPKNSRNS